MYSKLMNIPNVKDKFTPLHLKINRLKNQDLVKNTQSFQANEWDNVIKKTVGTIKINGQISSSFLPYFIVASVAFTLYV